MAGFVMRIMVTGAGGQLGRSILDWSVDNGLPAGWQLHALTRAELDIRDGAAIQRCMHELRPHAVINAAAWTDVEAAQRQPDEAWAVNAAGAGQVAAAARTYGARLLHISTDYVFDGRASLPIGEAVRPAPVNAYGAGKWAGEQQVRRFAPDALVIRTAWVYSRHGDNFVGKILAAARSRGELQVVRTETGSPTWAGDVAGMLMALLRRHDVPAGLYHWAGTEALSRYEWACEIMACARRHDPRWGQIPVTASEPVASTNRVVRPSYTVLSSLRLQALLGISPGTVRQHLQAVVAAWLES